MRGMRRRDLDMIDVKRRSSPKRLRVGGAAILAVAATNHHKQVAGSKARKPFLRKSLRVLVDSWRIPAKENSAGEDRPWASIIVNAPDHPQGVIEVTPATTNPMWATEE